jgi:hypothetical protein
MGNIGAVLDGGVVADVAGDERTVPYPRGDVEIMVPEQHVPHRAQADEPVKPGIADQGGLKGIAYEKIVPSRAKIVVLDENLYLPGSEPAPGRSGPPGLPVPLPILVFPLRKVLRGDKIITIALGRQNHYVVHS